jgi:Ankyrin repeats (many copies)
MTAESAELTDLVDERRYDEAVQAIRRLVDSGVPVDEIRDTRHVGDAPLWVRLLEEGQREVALFALEAGADPNGRFIDRPAIKLAAQKGFEDLVVALIEHGVDVKAQDSHGETALLEAAAHGHGGVVDALLDAGAEVEALDGYGRSPFMVAAGSSGKVTIMQRLVAAGADPKRKDKDGRTALSSAVGASNQAAVEYLGTLGVGGARPERVQAVITFSRRAMSDWDRSELHRRIEQSQVDLNRMRDTDVFRTRHVVAGDSVDDIQYIYASLREALTDLGGHEMVVHRCYLHDFTGSDGNDGRYVIVLDRRVDQPSAADGKPLDAEAEAVAGSDVGKPTEVSMPLAPPSPPMPQATPSHGVPQNDSPPPDAGSAGRWARPFRRGRRDRH